MSAPTAPTVTPPSPSSSSSSTASFATAPSTPPQLPTPAATSTSKIPSPTRRNTFLHTAQTRGWLTTPNGRAASSAAVAAWQANLLPAVASTPPSSPCRSQQRRPSPPVATSPPGQMLSESSLYRDALSSSSGLFRNSVGGDDVSSPPVAPPSPSSSSPQGRRRLESLNTNAPTSSAPRPAHPLSDVDPQQPSTTVHSNSTVTSNATTNPCPVVVVIDDDNDDDDDDDIIDVDGVQGAAVSHLSSSLSRRLTLDTPPSRSPTRAPRGMVGLGPWTIREEDIADDDDEVIYVSSSPSQYGEDVEDDDDVASGRPSTRSDCTSFGAVTDDETPPRAVRRRERGGGCDVAEDNDDDNVDSDSAARVRDGEDSEDGEDGEESSGADDASESGDEGSECARSDIDDIASRLSSATLARGEGEGNEVRGCLREDTDELTATNGSNGAGGANGLRLSLDDVDREGGAGNDAEAGARSGDAESAESAPLRTPTRMEMREDESNDVEDDSDDESDVEVVDYMTTPRTPSRTPASKDLHRSPEHQRRAHGAGVISGILTERNESNKTVATNGDATAVRKRGMVGRRGKGGGRMSVEEAVSRGSLKGSAEWLGTGSFSAIRQEAARRLLMFFDREVLSGALTAGTTEQFTAPSTGNASNRGRHATTSQGDSVPLPFTPAARVTVGWNGRLYKTAGQTYLRRRGGNGERIAAIELSTKVIDEPVRLYNTLAHEMCHAATWIVDAVCKPPHGVQFKRWAGLFAQFDGGLQITTCHDYAIRCRFTYVCVQCGLTYGRHSRSIDTEKQVCGRCKGRLRLEDGK